MRRAKVVREHDRARERLGTQLLFHQHVPQLLGGGFGYGVELHLREERVEALGGAQAEQWIFGDGLAQIAHVLAWLAEVTRRADAEGFTKALDVRGMRIRFDLRRHVD